jgi:hypothetical protein
MIEITTQTGGSVYRRSTNASSTMLFVRYPPSFRNNTSYIIPTTIRATAVHFDRSPLQSKEQTFP